MLVSGVFVLVLKACMSQEHTGRLANRGYPELEGGDFRVSAGHITTEGGYFMAMNSQMSTEGYRKTESEMLVPPTGGQGSTAEDSRDTINGERSQSTFINEAAKKTRVQDQENTQVHIFLGGITFMVCEQSMLCDGRCLQAGGGSRSVNDITANLQQVSQVSFLYNLSLLNTTTEKAAHFTNPQETGFTNHELLSALTQETGFTNHELLSAILEDLGDDGKLQHNQHNEDFRLLNSNTRDSKDADKRGHLRFNRGDDESSCSAHQANNTICFCDEVCVLYGDCCPDVFLSCHQLSSTKDIVSFISSVWKSHFGSVPGDGAKRTPQTTEAYLIDFMTEFASCENTSFATGMLLVNRCPSSNQDMSLKDKCERVDGLQPPPVTAGFPYGDVTFKNVYCAQCHGVSNTTSLKVWSVGYTCQPEVPADISLDLADLANSVSAGNCTPNFTQPEYVCKPRQCDPYATFNKEQEWTRFTHTGQCTPDTVTLCLSYYYPSLDFKKNVHCEVCLKNSRRRREERSSPSCNVQFQAIISKPFPGGILLILDLTGRYSAGTRGISSFICQDSQVFEPYSLTCKTLTCPLGSRPYMGHCTASTNTSVINGASQIYPDGWSEVVVTLTSGNCSQDSCVVTAALNSSLLTQTEFRENQSCTLDAINEELASTLSLTGCGALVEHKENQSCTVDAINEGLDSTLSLTGCETLVEFKDQLRDIFARVLARIFSPVPETTDQTQILTTELAALAMYNNTYQMVVSNINNSTIASCRCSGNNSFHQVREYSITEKNGTLYVLTKTSRREIYYPLRNVGLQVTLSRDCDQPTTWVMNRSVSVCDTWLYLRDNCSVITYKLNDTRQNGSRLMVLSSGLYYEDGDFQISGDDVLVCTNFSFQYELVTAAIHQSLVYLILTWSLTIISVASLLLMLTLYCLFPQLRTLPGKMTASLAATMMLTFVSNLFTTMQLHHDYICPIAAALSHVISLAHFGWMSAIAVNMALTFGPLYKKLARTASDKALFLRYNLVVWASSIVVVMTAVTLDLTHPEPNTSEIAIDNYPRYGHPYCTWFSGPTWTKLAFVVMPYSITIIICLAGFLLTLIGIQRARMSVQRLGKKSSEKTHCVIYLKLSSAMGFSWAFSALSNLYPEIVALSYLYMCLILIQGLLLFLSFMVNQRVYFLLQELVSSKTRKHSKKEVTEQCHQDL